MTSRRRHIVVMMTVIAMLFSVITFQADNVAYAEDPVEVTVYEDGSIKKTFTLSELEAIQAVEGDVSYDYSGCNTRGNRTTELGCKGPTIKGILSEAGIVMSSNQKIAFIANDDYATALTEEQLSENRYYFTNGAIGTANGKAGDEDARTPKTTVPAILALNKEGGRVSFGQTAPNEQNRPAWNKNMLGGGSIIVENSVNQVNNDISIKDAETEFEPGESITLESGSGLLSGYTKVYYTLDGSAATRDNDIYNYNTNSFPNVYATITAPATIGTYKINVMVTEHGKSDSVAKELTYDVVPLGTKTEAPSKVNGLKAVSLDYNSAKISWSTSVDGDGYILYRSEKKNGTYKEVATLAGQSKINYKDTNLGTGKTYYYKVAAYKVNKTLTGELSSAVSAKPALAVPKSIKAKAKGKKKIAITAKKVAGQNGFTIYRSTKKNKGFKAIKTVKTKNNLKYTDKKVKSGKKYYYKVKAYRIVDKAKVYGAFSKVAARKAK